MIAARTGRMAQGLTSAKGQDLKELSLMSSEKAEALTASAGAVAASAGAIGRRLGQAAMDEGALALQAAAAIGGARTPAQAAEAQFRYALGWWNRAANQALTLNDALLRAQADAVAPIHKTATANAKRLRRKT
nr:phasin family protein [uncultured Brevundimonas sp.]